MKLIRYATVAVTLAMGSVAADKRMCGDASDVTPTLTPAPTPTTEAPTPAPTTETPVPTTATPIPTTETPAPTTEAPTPAPTTQTPAPTRPTQGLTFRNNAMGKSLVVSALPVTEGVCYTYYPCLGGFATAMKWNVPLWTKYVIDRSIVYFFPDERCGGDAQMWFGLNEPYPFTGDYFPGAKSVLFRTDPSVGSASFDPSFIARHSACE